MWSRFSHDLTLLSKMQEDMAEVEWHMEFVFTLIANPFMHTAFPALKLYDNYSLKWDLLYKSRSEMLMIGIIPHFMLEISPISL